MEQTPILRSNPLRAWLADACQKGNRPPSRQPHKLCVMRRSCRPVSYDPPDQMLSNPEAWLSPLIQSHPCLRPSSHHWNESLQGRWFWNGAKLIGMNAFCCNLIRALHSGVTQEASFTCNLMVLQMSVVWWCLDWSWLGHKKAGACFDSWARKQVQTSQGSPSTCWARIYN